MEEYRPPYSITNAMLDRVSSISEKLGHLGALHSLESKPQLRRNNRIRSIHSSLKIEANSLSLGQVREVIAGRNVIGDRKDIQEVKNAYAAYEMLNEINPCSIADLLKLHEVLTRYTVDESGAFRKGEEGVFSGDRCIFMAPPARLVPQLMESLNTLNRNFPSYITGLQNLANSALASLGVKGDLYQMVSPYWNQIFEYLKNFFAQLVPWLLNFSANLVCQVMNLLVTFVTCIYFLFNKELFARQLKKLCYAIFPVRFNESLLETVQIVDETFGGYINGQLVDAVVIGTLTTVSMVLVGVIVACTNVIPMVGPFIGAIPSFFIILMAGKPMQALGFVVLILVIQQIDGNILAPKIVGGSTNLSGFWVLFSIIVAGGLFGIGGIVLCVPTLSVFFKLLRRWTDSSLRSRGLPEPSQAYAKGQFPRPAAGLEDNSEKE